MLDVDDLNRQAAALVLAGAVNSYPGEDSDWASAFQEATQAISAAVGCDTSVATFERDNVRVILRASEGENDGANWICVVLLDDARWAFVSAGCDYTGWDCQAGGHTIVADDLATLIRLGLGEEDRARLDLHMQE